MLGRRAEAEPRDEVHPLRLTLLIRRSKPRRCRDRNVSSHTSVYRRHLWSEVAEPRASDSHTEHVVHTWTRLNAPAATRCQHLAEKPYSCSSARGRAEYRLGKNSSSTKEALNVLETQKRHPEISGYFHRPQNSLFIEADASGRLVQYREDAFLRCSGRSVRICKTYGRDVPHR